MTRRPPPMLTQLDQAKIDAGFLPGTTIEQVEATLDDSLAKAERYRQLIARMRGEAPFRVRGNGFGGGYCVADENDVQVVPDPNEPGLDRRLGLGLHDANALAKQKNADANGAEAA